MKTRNIYAIIDKIAEDIFGQTFEAQNDTAAIRFYCDIGNDPNSIIGRHAADFDLVRLGQVQIDKTVQLDVTHPETVLTGEQFAAMLTPKDQQHNLKLAQ